MPKFSPYAPEILWKTPETDRVYWIDFEKFQEIIDGQTIASAVVTVDEEGLTIGSPSISGSKVMFRISGGTLDDPDTELVFHIHVAATTSAGRVLPGAGILYLTK